MAWQRNGTPDTLSGSGDVLEISDLTPLEFNVFLSNNIAASAIPQAFIRFGSSSADTGNNYSYRISLNGATDATTVSTSSIGFEPLSGSNDSSFGIIFAFNLAAEEKLTIEFNVSGNSGGAPTAPNRQETVGKWVNTSDQFDVVNLFNGNTGDYATNSNLSALGTD